MAFKPVGQGSYPVYAPPLRQKVQAKEDKKGPVEIFESPPKRSIIIVDYGLGNLRSVQKALEKMGFDAKISDRAEDIASAGGLIIPGVGAFGAAMKNLSQLGLIDPIKAYLKSGRPFLGICLGLQILFESSEEVFAPTSSDGAGPEAAGAISGTGSTAGITGAGSPTVLPSAGGVPGLGVLSGTVKKFSFPPDSGLQIPHMGWNTIDYKQKMPLLTGVPKDSMFYFVHSYYVAPVDPACVGATTPYGIDFVSIVQKGNIFAVQFHPEKSGPVGLQILANFGRLTARVGT